MSLIAFGIVSSGGKKTVRFLYILWGKYLKIDHSTPFHSQFCSLFYPSPTKERTLPQHFQWELQGLLRALVSPAHLDVLMWRRSTKHVTADFPLHTGIMTCLSFPNSR